MKAVWATILISLLASLALAACASDRAAPPQVEGPALVLFYTDN